MISIWIFSERVANQFNLNNHFNDMNGYNNKTKSCLTQRNLTYCILTYLYRQHLFYSFPMTQYAMHKTHTNLYIDIHWLLQRAILTIIKCMFTKELHAHETKFYPIVHCNLTLRWIIYPTQMIVCSECSNI